MRKKSLITEADERVSIVLACQLIGVEVQEGRTAGSTKTYCPFGRFYHSDGGKDPAFRIYPESNSAYCFSCKKFFTPTTLVSDAWDVSKKSAAAELLDRVGYKPISASDLWKQVQHRDVQTDTSMLGMALRTYCKRICSEWQSIQFEPEISAVLGRCLNLLSSVITEEDADLWLTSCKEIMTRVLTQRANI